MRSIPILRPLLPTSERLLPYLRRIDESRTYSNWGPLASELEARLCKSFGLAEGCVSSASSGTAAVVGGILAKAGRASTQRPYAVIPAYTFVATATAVEECGYRPYLADVDPKSWMLDPSSVGRLPLDEVGLVIPVAPYGRPVPQRPWVEFQRQTKIPVVIDGAACFDCLIEAPREFIGEIPLALSFHATKSFGVGEGGCVISTNAADLQRIFQALNFGFHGTRESRTPHVNGKMSEYHAAVGLAELDGWDEKRAALERVIDGYRTRAAAAKISDRLILAPSVSRSYVLFRCRDVAETKTVQAALVRHQVDFRFWYGQGLHRHAYFADAKRERLDRTEEIASCVLGLPLAADLTPDDVTQVIAALADGIAG